MSSPSSSSSSSSTNRQNGIPEMPLFSRGSDFGGSNLLAAAGHGGPGGHAHARNAPRLD